MQKKTIINSLFVVPAELEMAGAQKDGKIKKIPVKSTRSRQSAIDKDGIGERGVGLTTVALGMTTKESTEVPLTRTRLTSGEITEAQELLRQFDMTMRYGPCAGMPRSDRWERARRFGLDPPRCIWQILKDTRYQKAISDIDNNLWYRELS